MALSISRKGLLVLLAFLGLPGCTTLGYYAQAIGGQVEILAKRRPISAWLEDPKTPAALKQRLARVLEIRVFATQALALPDNGSFRSYADVGRPYVVWSVFAAPEFSVDLKQWCYPVVGCAAYRGYFSQARAQSFTEALRAKGYDGYVAGIPAYSTLGWFDDPLMNTVVNWSEADLAGLIFHELAHQRLYIRDDSTFNESFAHLVEEEGVRRWMAQQDRADKLPAYRAKRRQTQDFAELVLEIRKRLKAVYDTTIGVEEKRSVKAQVLSEMRARFGALKRTWGASAAYEAWFATPLNNAKLGSVAAYYEHVPAFQTLLISHVGDLAAFYRAAERIGRLAPERRDAVLRELGAKAQSGPVADATPEPSADGKAIMPSASH